MKITAMVSTKDRYYTTLPMTILSVAQQTYKPDELLIYDDGEQKDLRNDPVYKSLFTLLNAKKISWKVIFGERRGQVANHQRSIKDAEGDWIWRMDDDNSPEPTCLEQLVSLLDDKVGAIGGLVLHPNGGVSSLSIASSKIEDIYLGLNSQWFKQTGVYDVDHLYSTFLYRKEAASHGYCTWLSPVGHREETIFTYEMKRNGWKLLVNPSAVTWHFRQESGGIRTSSKVDMWQHDENIFRNKMNEWGVVTKEYKLIVLDNGIGDHLIFKSVLPDLKKKHKNIIMAVCYPEVFMNDEVTLISIAEAKLMGDIGEYNVYKKAWDWNNKGPLESVYRRIYDC